MGELNGNKSMYTLSSVTMQVFIKTLPKVLEGFLTIPVKNNEGLEALAMVRCTDLIAHVSEVHMTSILTSVNDIANGGDYDWHQDNKAEDRLVERYCGVLDEFITEWRSRLDAVIAKRWTTLDEMGKRMLLQSHIYGEKDQPLYSFLY